jgi:glycosyltransferase involved in cell wall biosynthesis
MMEPKKVVIFVGSFIGGGIERAVLTFLRGIDLTRFEPHILCLLKTGSLLPQYEALGFPICEMRLRSWTWLQVIWRVRRYLLQERIEMIHSHAFHCDFIARLAAAWVGIPWLSTLHTNSTWKRKPVGLSLRWRLWLDMKSVHFGRGHFIGLTDSIREFHTTTLDYPASAWQIIPNPLDVARISVAADAGLAVRSALGLPDNKVLVVAVGNLLAVKGHIHLLRALKLLPPEVRSRCHVAIAGEGPERSALEEFCKSNPELATCVSLLGYREDIGEILAAADIYTMPSLSEGQSVAILEAMYAKTPMLLTTNGSHVDFLQDGHNALLADPQAEEAFSVALARLIEAGDLREKLAQAAEQTLLTLGVLESVAAQQCFYDNILAEAEGVCE